MQTLWKEETVVQEVQKQLQAFDEMQTPVMKRLEALKKLLQV